MAQGCVARGLTEEEHPMKGLLFGPGRTPDLAAVPVHLQSASAHLRGWDGHRPYLSPDGFLFNPTTGLTYALNPTGALIYRALEAGLGLDATVERLTGDFDVDAATARADLIEFLQQMRVLGLS
jgi:Coenzyme PQQ synthesis protein D (PqqD)